MRTLRIEELDSRRTLDGTSSASAMIPWLNLGQLTYSFVPDGTVLADHSSSLFEELTPTGAEQLWQSAFEQAFNEWLTPLGVDAHLVDDSGLAFGAFGPTQGDARFGDIRIGAIPLSNNVMAEAVPHSIISQGTWAGDIFFNSNAEWSSLQQVLSVALHEIGHVLGVGHSSDPSSPMYVHGASSATRPTASDLAQLSRLYAGVSIENDTHESEQSSSSQWQERPKFQFDVSKAIPLAATVGTTVRFTASGTLDQQSTSLLYRLEAVGEIDHAEYMNIVVKARDEDGLIADVAVYSMSGDPLPSRVLSNSNGTKVIQVRDVEPNKSYFVAVTPTAGPARYQVGSFELFAAYSLKSLVPTQVGTIALDATHPVAEQAFAVATSRLVHLLIQSRLTNSRTKISGDSNAVWATLVNSDGEALARVAMLPGDSRSAPLVMLEPGDYRIVFESGSRAGSPLAVTLTAFLDEISIDVGISSVDPTNQPMVFCGSPGADPATCSPQQPNINVGGPIYPPLNSPSTPVQPPPPWTSPSWHYWPTPIAPTFIQNPVNRLDVSGDNSVSPLDALLIVNLLNTADRTTINSSGLFYDTSGDGNASPLDALLVINALNVRQGLSALGEGELQSATADPLTTWQLENLDMDLKEIEKLRARAGFSRAL